MKKYAVKKICVYCGSADGILPIYGKTAKEFGLILGRKGYELVFGGAASGTMKIIADAVLEAGGKVTGIIPRDIIGEIAHDGLTELIVVDSMHTRKRMMIEKSDVIVAMPGGFGTMDEIMEAFSWRQLELHSNQCYFLNTAGYYDLLLEFLKFCSEQGFLRPHHYSLIQVAKTPEEFFGKIEIL